MASPPLASDGRGHCTPARLSCQPCGPCGSDSVCSRHMNSRAAYLLANPPILSVNDIIDLESHRGESRRVSAQHVVGVRGRLAADGLALQFTIRGIGVD